MRKTLLFVCRGTVNRCFGQTYVDRNFLLLYNDLWQVLPAFLSSLFMLSLFEGLQFVSDDFTRIPKIYVELRTCLPRFICEVHAQGPGMGVTSDLEKDVLSLFRWFRFFLCVEIRSETLFPLCPRYPGKKA